MKTIITLVLCSLFASSAWAANYFDKGETCLNTSDIQKVQSHFTQFKNFSNVSSDKVCKGQGIDAKWFEVARSVLAMERLKVTDDLQRDANDDFTLRPIGQKDWWGYFTERANRFVIEPSYCRTNDGIVAFVYMFRRGEINLCPRFFEMDPASQIEVLMHEVRHFEGHGHVTCSQGNENGSQGACDGNIKSGGSYAVSVQASVELSFVDQLSHADRVLSESSAVYSVNNKFNSLPTVKARDYIYLSNAEGEIHRAATDNLSETEIVATLDAPVRIYGNGSQFTVFPYYTTEKAYRTSRDFKVNAASIGAFANQYNAETESERLLYTAVNYYGVGAIAKDDVLFSFCGTTATTLSSLKFDGGTVKSLVNLKNAANQDETYVLSETGDLYDFKCNDRTSRLSATKVGMTLPRDAQDVFGLTKGSAYILNDGGELVKFDVNEQTTSATDLPAGKWVSASPLKVYNVFDTITE